MIRLSFYRGLFVAAITAATVSEMADAVRVDIDDMLEDDDDLLMPQTDIGLDNTANLVSDVDSNTNATASTAADADSEFITNLFNKAKGGISGLMTRAGNLFRSKKAPAKVAQAQAKTNNKAKKAIVKNKKVANKKNKQQAKQKKEL